MPGDRASRLPGDDRGARVTLPSECEILIVRRFAAPRAAVFDAWTSPEHVTHWWDPSREPLAACDIDLRPNGRFRFVPGGGKPAFTGVYREIVRPERLVFSTVVASGAETVGTLRFDADGRHTILRLTMTCASQSDRDALLEMRVDAGTVRTLENLGEYLERPASRPASS